MASQTKTLAQTERNALLVQGVVSILFGIAAVVWPGLTVEALVYLFAAFLLIDGVIVIGMGLIGIKRFSRPVLITLGLLQLIVGALLLRNSDVAFDTLILVLGLALIVRGLFALTHAFTIVKNHVVVRALHAFLGVLGVVVGVMILMQPTGAGLAFVWLLGLYALVAGPVMIAIASDIAKTD